ncbi:putative caleosin-containing protein [Coleophoma crateriformis]|uniref:Putative caleosin-containing protein n=1 Tax=Coleophoma crateriformis TaxID=565419 RepID=A0A3D8QIA0_9HELO|nr:putative caleosin-containing protein [Coleophoma crateriformis]
MAPARITVDGFDTGIEEVPVTEARTPFIQDRGNEVLRQPGTARANQAASVEAPNGTLPGPYSRRKHQTVLQQHCAFFDRDGDGVIWPLDTYRGFYALGYGFFLSMVALVIIHSNFSYPTLSGLLPDPFFRIYIDNIHKDKHGSDSGTYDNEGRFIPQKFEDIFAKYASGDKQSISGQEIIDYLKGQRVIMDPIGWFAAIFEWLATYILLWPADGRMQKEDIRRIYDGSLFYEIAARREKGKKA